MRAALLALFIPGAFGWWLCPSVPRERQLGAMLATLNRTAELAASPPDPIFGIWFLNWRHMVGHDTLFSDGLMALLEPEAWNATSRVYSLRPLKYDAWTVSANLLGTFDYLTQYNTGVLQTREIHFGDQNEITSITDVSWNGRRRLQKWIATPINATEGTFERWNRVDGAGVESATSVSDGGYDYTGVKLYDRSGAYPSHIAEWQRDAYPRVYDCT